MLFAVALCQMVKFSPDQRSKIARSWVQRGTKINMQVSPLNFWQQVGNSRIIARLGKISKASCWGIGNTCCKPGELSRACALEAAIVLGLTEQTAKGWALPPRTRALQRGAYTCRKLADQKETCRITLVFRLVGPQNKKCCFRLRIS